MNAMMKADRTESMESIKRQAAAQAPREKPVVRLKTTTTDACGFAMAAAETNRHAPPNKVRPDSRPDNCPPADLSLCRIGDERFAVDVSRFVSVQQFGELMTIPSTTAPSPGPTSTGS